MNDGLMTVFAAVGLVTMLWRSRPTPPGVDQATSPTPERCPTCGHSLEDDKPPAAAVTAASEDDEVAVPRWMLEQLYDHMKRLDALERREQMRLVRRAGRDAKRA